MTKEERRWDRGGIIVECSATKKKYSLLCSERQIIVPFHRGTRTEMNGRCSLGIPYDSYQFAEDLHSVFL